MSPYDYNDEAFKNILNTQISEEKNNMQKQYDKTMNNMLFNVDRFKEGDKYERELEKAHQLSIEAKSLILNFSSI